MRMRVDIQNCIKQAKISKSRQYVVDCFFEHLKQVIKKECDLEDFADLYCLRGENILKKIIQQSYSDALGIKAIKYRKKPVVIEAFQYDDCVYEIPWIDIDIPIKGEGFCIIKTLEGDMRCDSGDYIIKGIKGEFYSCKPDIFEASHEKIED